MNENLSLEDIIAAAINAGFGWEVWLADSPRVKRVADALRAAGVVPAEPATHDHDDEVLDIITGIEAERVEFCRKALAAADELDAIAYDGMALKPRDRLFRIAAALRAASVVLAEPATHARDEFLAASVAVWREIDSLSAEPDGYRGLDASTELRRRERAAWEAYRAVLDACVRAALAAVDGEAPAT